MKKFALFSLLALTFPLTAFAETTESVPNPTAATQEQTLESIPAAEETIDPSTVVKDTEAKIEGLEPEVTINSSETKNAETETKESQETEGTKQSESLETKINEVETKETETEKEKEYTPAVIRDHLKDNAYGISQVELDNYTDQQLSTAWKIFERYNYDITGMDFGSYVRVLRKAYKENVISPEKVEKVLAFNPSQYKTTDELIQNIDQLYDYIQALYPKGNGFVELSHLSKEELVHILNFIAPDQERIASINGNLFSGFVNWIQAAPVGNAPIDNGPKKPDEITNIATNSNQTADTPKKADLTVDQQTSTQKQYPKTGEQHTVYLTVIGMVFVISAGLITWRKKLARH
ncbi:hypothetical protein NRIC_10310 [Enterococcus florum]|uniref:Gram-positive cocci surface proteins LPxTG domain-containing protein n=1 Tax=Enterococcus florum TaxID=2480627 RepID=A0A4P5P607_9ENTE|nr:LPXTG cell wall anchor domain-containing protein [Enterococcus florum]GCF93140.1 hypothetical protein NRIC_10310 [Enterococcus florum]